MNVPFGILASNLNCVIDYLKFSDYSKTCDLDLQGQIGLQICKRFKMFKLLVTYLEFTFAIKLFIDHLKVLDKIETGDLVMKVQIFV